MCRQTTALGTQKLVVQFNPSALPVFVVVDIHVDYRRTCRPCFGCMYTCAHYVAASFMCVRFVACVDAYIPYVRQVQLDMRYASNTCIRSVHSFVHMMIRGTTQLDR